jgi:hypothetical protein
VKIRQIFYLAGNGGRVDDVAASKSGMRASGFHFSGNYFEQKTSLLEWHTGVA